jgi:glycerol-3-phosphate dehydrogenase subunit C
LLGSLAAGPLAPVSNLIHAHRLVRKVTEKVAGISAEFPLPPFARKPFPDWLAHHEPLPEAGTKGEVAIFSTCTGDSNFPSMPANAVRVLEKNGYAVVRPEQVCCGIPNIDGGDIEAAKEKARYNVASLVREVHAGRKIVVPGPTCSYALKKEYPELLGTDDARLVAKNTFDLMEFLEQLRRAKTLHREFQKGFGKVAYHAPCHLRAQKVGFPAARILSQLPDTTVETIQACSAVDGTWGMKAQYYEMGRRYARDLVQGVQGAEPSLVVSDCVLAAQRLRKETGQSVLHPIEALADAYGIAVGVS